MLVVEAKALGVVLEASGRVCRLHERGHLSASALLCTTVGHCGPLRATSTLTRSQYSPVKVGADYTIQRRTIIGNAPRVPYMVRIGWVGQVAQCTACLLYILGGCSYEHPQ